MPELDFYIVVLTCSFVLSDLILHSYTSPCIYITTVRSPRAPTTFQQTSKLGVISDFTVFVLIRMFMFMFWWKFRRPGRSRFNCFKSHQARPRFTFSSMSTSTHWMLKTWKQILERSLKWSNFAQYCFVLPGFENQGGNIRKNQQATFQWEKYLSDETYILFLEK